MTAERAKRRLGDYRSNKMLPFRFQMYLTGFSVTLGTKPTFTAVVTLYVGVFLLNYLQKFD